MLANGEYSDPHLTAAAWALGAGRDCAGAVGGAYIAYMAGRYNQRMSKAQKSRRRGRPQPAPAGLSRRESLAGLAVTVAAGIVGIFTDA